MSTIREVIYLFKDVPVTPADGTGARDTIVNNQSKIDNQKASPWTHLIERNMWMKAVE